MLDTAALLRSAYSVDNAIHCSLLVLIGVYWSFLLFACIYYLSAIHCSNLQELHAATLILFTIVLLSDCVMHGSVVQCFKFSFFSSSRMIKG